MTEKNKNKNKQHGKEETFKDLQKGDKKLSGPNRPST